MNPVSCDPGCCPEQFPVNVPGPTGPTGAAGADGVDGVNAFTLLNGSLIIPTVGANVTATVANNTWMAVGEPLYITDGVSQGTFLVASLTGSTVVALTFEGATGDSNPGNVIGSGGTVSASAVPLSSPVSVANGGTGDTALTDRSVLIGRGAGAIEFAAPGANPQPLLSTGAATNPAFGPLNLAGTSTVTGELPPASGGTGVVTLTDRSIIIGRGTGAVEFAAPGADPQPLLSTGVATNPAFGALDLAGSNTVINELLPLNGGTGAATLTDRSVIIGRGAAPVEFAAPSTAGVPLVSTGAASNPAFTALNLASAFAITGTLPLANGGTGGTSKAAAIANLGVGQAAIVARVSVASTYVLTNAAAVIAFSGTDIAVTLTAAGIWHLYFGAVYEYNGATFAANETIHLAIQRTNNTPAALDPELQPITAVLTTETSTAFSLNSGPIPYTTANTDDYLELQTYLSTLPSAGDVRINFSQAYLIAVPISI